MEGKQSLAENELRQMRSNLRDYEILVEDYRTQVCSYLIFLPWLVCSYVGLFKIRG